jgi:hypothetical protein
MHAIWAGGAVCSAGKIRPRRRGPRLQPEFRRPSVRADLKGYEDYAARVRYRFIPFIW